GAAPSGRNGLAEVAAAGITMIRTGFASWTTELVDGQIQTERAILRAAAAHGLACWVWLGGVPNLPARAGSVQEQLLVTIVGALRDDPALGAGKGTDEPALARVPPAGLVRAYKRLKALDAKHPLVLVEAPLGTVAELTPYSSACDITGADVYPVSYPPG